MKVDKTKINTTDKYEGYKLDSKTVVPDTVNSGDVIKVYYIIDEENTKDLSYTVEYYKDGTKVDGDTQTEKTTVQVLQPDTMKVDKTKINTTDKYEGYKLEKTVVNEEEKAIPDTVNNGDVIKVYYIIDEENTKDLSYTVEYYKDGTKVDGDTQTEKTTVQILQPDTMTVDKAKINTTDKYTGYQLEKTVVNEEEKAIPDTVNNGDVIKVYYIIDEENTKDLSYTVEYYKDGTKVDGDTQTEKTTVQVLQPDTMTVNKEKINLVDKYEGYKLDSKTVVPDTVNNGEVIKVYYVTDEAQTKDLSYTVEYYKDGKKVDGDTQTEKTTVQVLQPDTMKVDKTKINTTDKYTGYKLEKTVVNEEERAIPDTVNNGDVIKVYYIIDEENTKDLSYTVEYYKDGTRVDGDTQTEKTTVQVLQPDTMKVDKTKLNTTDKYTGYKLEKTVVNEEEKAIPDTVNSGDVIKVYYIIDEENTKDLSYTVEYYKDGTKVDGDTQTEKTTVQVLQPDTMTVNKAKINTTDKYTGYKLEKTVVNEEERAIPDTVNNGDVIKVYYIIDEENTKDLSYTVEYYKDGTKVDGDTQTEKTTVQVLQPDTMLVNKEKINLVDKYEGYKLDSKTVVPDTVNNGDIIKVYYVTDEAQTKDLSYTVEYYKDGTKVDEDTQTEKTTVQVLQPDTMKVDKTKINTTDKYTGYKLEKTVVNEEEKAIPDTVNKGNVIKVYYIIDEENTKDLSYTVEYYKDGIKVDGDTQTEKTTVQVLQPDTMKVDKTKINTTDKYEGYKLDSKTVVPDTVNNGEVIKVYYIIDEENTKDLSYTVEYYKDGKKVDEDTQTEKTTVQVLQPDTMTVNKEKINLVDKYEGYKLDSKTVVPDTVNSGDVIKVYYIIDEENTKDLSYTVEYYKDGTKVDGDTQTEKTTVQVLQPDTMTVDKAKINTTNKYEGYKLDSKTVVTDTVNNGEVIKVYYVTDEAQTKDLSYTVEYYKDGKKVDGDTQTEKTTVQVLQPDTMTVNKEKINLVDKYEGYKLDSKTVVPDTVNDGDVIKVYYIIDEENTKDLSYTVEYYKDGTKVDGDTQTEKTTVQVLQPDTMIVDKAKINTTDKYEGYKLDSKTVVPDTVNNGDVIKVYYIIDEENTKDLSYTVEYYKDGTKVDGDTQTEKTTVQVLQPDTMTVNKEKINLVDKYEGYKLDSKTVVTDTVNNGEVIKVYYVTDEAQTKDLSYTVEYYKDGTKVDEDTQTEKTTVQVLQPDTMTVNKEKINLVDKYEGYKLDSKTVVPDTVNNGDIIKVYYVKRADLSYKVNYLEKDSNKALKEQKVVDNVTYNDAIISSQEVIQISGYNYDSVDKESLIITTNTEENVINIYYTKKEATVIAHYYIEGTTEKVPSNNGSLIEDVTIKGKVFDEYKTEKAKNVLEKYELVKVPQNATGTMTEEVIEVIYYYRLKNTQLIIKYLEKDTNIELAPQESRTGKVDDEYTTTAKEIENYTLVENPENATGTLTVEPITVIYYYLQNTKVIVNHINKNIMDIPGSTLEQAIILKEEQPGLVGDSYTGTAKDFEGYVLVEKPEEETVIMTKDIIELNYYYTHISAGVIEKHIDITSNEILESNLYKGKTGDPYSTSAKEFEGYELVKEKLPTNAEGTMTANLIEVKYYYIRKASVKVEYIDKITGKEILEENGKESTEYIYGYEGNSYETKAKTFKGYTIVKEMYPQNTKGEMKVTVKEDGTIDTETIVKYYYVKISGGVVEKHINIKTNELLEKETKYEGNEGDKYTTKAKEFEGYELVEEKIPANAEGTMTVEKIIVNYYYVRKTQVIERHIDVKTNELIEKETKYEGHEGEEYKTTEKVFSGYDIVKEKMPENAKGIMAIITKEDGTISTETVVNYYYIRKVQVLERHINEENGELLEEVIIHEGHEGDSYKTSSKEFKGYEINKDKLPENKEGTMKVTTKEDGTINTTIVVNYYYKKVTETEKLNETPKDESNNSNIHTVVNNIYNNINNTSNEKLPNTGDTSPIIAVNTIILVVLLNIIQLKVTKGVKYTRIQKSVISGRNSRGKRAKGKVKSKGKGKRCIK